MYRKFRDDPSSVDPSWHEFLVDYNPEPTGEPPSSAPATGDGQPAASAPQAKPAPAAQPS
ncbi:2-oxoglutarate decarboxylase, partial [Mycobacterium parascrofulaceum ATCC BAA-614]